MSYRPADLLVSTVTFKSQEFMRLDAAVFVYCTGQCADWRSPRGQDWSSVSVARGPAV